MIELYTSKVEGLRPHQLNNINTYVSQRCDLKGPAFSKMKPENPTFCNYDKIRGLRFDETHHL